MEYSVVARNTAKGISEVNYSSTMIVFDSSKDRNQNFAGPTEILCAAFAACCLKNVERFSDLLKFEYSHAEIEVKAIREDKPPRISSISYTLSVRTNESEHRMELVHKNLKQFGTIYNTLNASCQISGDIKRLT